MESGYRSYCVVCCNYRLLHRFVTGEYTCARCIRKITTRLKKRDIYLDQHLPLPMKEIDEVIESVQKDVAGEKKTLERDYRLSQRPPKIISNPVSAHAGISHRW